MFRVETANGSNDLVLRFVRPATILTEPLNQTAECATGSATLTVVAAGSEPLSYQWRFNGVDVPGANGPALNLDQPLAVAAGNYDVIVANSFGAVTSVVAALTLIDSVPPAIVSCATDQTIFLAATNCQIAMPDLTGTVVVTDICGAVTVTQTPPAGTQVGPGIHAVTLNALDAANNPTNCTVTLTVVDQTPPVIVACVPNQNLGTDLSGQAMVPDWTTNLTILEACAGVTVVQSPPAGTLLAVGFHDIAFTVSDAANNQAACTTRVEVVNQTLSQITSDPSGQAIECTSNCTFTVVALGAAPLAYQWYFQETNALADATNAVLTLGPVHSLDAGAYRVVITNFAGSVTSTVAMLTVTDTTMPLIVACATNLTVSAGTNCQAMVPDLTGSVVANDACGAITVTQQPLPGSSVGPGAHPIVFIVTDLSNNTNTCSATLTVVDLTPPVFTVCPPLQTLPANATCRAVLPDLTALATAIDSCSAVIVTQSPPAGVSLDFGTTLVTLTARDAANNAATCTVSVAVIDATPPMIVTCAPSRVLSVNSNCQAVMPDLTGFVTASDTCGAVTITQNPLAGTVLGAGPTIATLRATDSGGLTASCQATVMVASVSLTITSQPNGTTNTAGAVVAFSVAAQGNAPLTYQWRKDSVDVMGASAPTLVIANAQLADSGAYSVRISDPCGLSRTSIVAHLNINGLPIARADAFGTLKNTALHIPVEALLANDTDPDGGSLIVTNVSPLSRAGGGVNLSGGAVHYTPPAGFLASDSFQYVIADAQGTFATGMVCVQINGNNLLFREPLGGWTYLYDGTAALAGADNAGFASLDGSWNHDNGSDAWALDGLGGTLTPGVNAPGGVAALGGFLRLQDAGDPRNYGFPETSAGGNAGSVGSNRRIYFGRSLTELGAPPNLLDQGATLTFRVRIPTNGLDDVYPGGGRTNAYPSTGDGYFIHDGGKGNLGIHQAAGGTISFSLATADVSGNAGLLMNNLNGTVISGAVDSGEGGVVNLVSLDPLAWHEFWITIQADRSDRGTHRLEVFVDGSLVPQVFHVTAGNGVESAFGAISYLALGLGATGQSGAFDVDFFGFKLGALPPIAFTDPEIPRLQIIPEGASVRISWSQTCVDFQLERATSLAGPMNWQPVTAPITAVGSRYQVILPSAGLSFFRLQQP